jgi:hypothetical protein
MGVVGDVDGMLVVGWVGFGFVWLVFGLIGDRFGMAEVGMVEGSVSGWVVGSESKYLVVVAIGLQETGRMQWYSKGCDVWVEEGREGGDVTLFLL